MEASPHRPPPPFLVLTQERPLPGLGSLPGTSEEIGHGMKSEKLASLRSASDTRISGRVLATRLSGRLGTDAVPPDTQWSADGLTDKNGKSLHICGQKNDHVLSTVRGRVYRIPVIGDKESYFSDPLMYQVVGAYRIRPPDATDGGEYVSCIRPLTSPPRGRM